MSTPKKPARDDVLNDIFDDLARALKRGVSYEDPETGKPEAALLNVARQFLKDQKWEGRVVPGTPVGDLADLPVFDDDVPGDASYQ